MQLREEMHSLFATAVPVTTVDIPPTEPNPILVDLFSDDPPLRAGKGPMSEADDALADELELIKEEQLQCEMQASLADECDRQMHAAQMLWGKAHQDINRTSRIHWMKTLLLHSLAVRHHRKIDSESTW